MKLSKSARSLLSLAKQRQKNGGRVERRPTNPKPFNDLVKAGLLHDDGRLTAAGISYVMED